MPKRALTLIALCLLSLQGAYSQHKKNAYEAYIDTYKDMAQEQMRKYQIPASITLAQGLLESGAGQSRLATKAHNHFGIKVSGGWKGPYILADDDKKNEKFRKYRKAADSYEDHSLFLQQPRYERLFRLSITDYKGWARGLQKCGYATNPHYAQSLISIVERYDLTRYDKYGKKSKKGKKDTYYSPEDFFALHRIGRCNGLYYIIATDEDDLKRISKAVGKSASKLRKYNEIPKGTDVYPGEIVYLEEKKSKADKSMKRVPHIVGDGETLHSISQLYGIKLETIYKRNHLSPYYAPTVGDELYVY
ncbi:MAG: glucosaminidase domain-containing protein [Prevotellaceae bacterium]|nr:glucosaminidase domain-containing protein [Prevotellaceae bacterium]